MSAVTAVARQRLSRRRGATIALVFLAGLSAAAPMAVWSAGRRTATSVESFLEWANPADLTLYICPPGYDVAAVADPEPCFAHDAEDERGVVETVSGVEHASRYGYSLIRGGPSDDPQDSSELALIGLFDPVPLATPFGDPIVVAGRLAAVDSPNELMVTEPTANLFDLAPGDQLWLRVAEDAGEPPIEATVAGVVRTPAEFLPIDESSEIGSAGLLARAGWVSAHGGDVTFVRAMAVWVDGSDMKGSSTRWKTNSTTRPSWPKRPCRPTSSTTSVKPPTLRAARLQW